MDSGVSSPESSSKSYIQSPTNSKFPLFGGAPTAALSSLISATYSPHPQSRPSAAAFQSSYGHSRSSSISSSVAAALQTPSFNASSSFYVGTPAVSNNEHVYIHVPNVSTRKQSHQASSCFSGDGNTSESGNDSTSPHDIWVTVPWSAIGSKLMEYPGLLLGLVSHFKADPSIKNHMLRMLADHSPQGESNIPPSLSYSSHVNLSDFPPMPNQAIWNSSARESDRRDSMSQVDPTFAAVLPPSHYSSASSPVYTEFTSTAPPSIDNSGINITSEPLSPTAAIFNQFPSLITAAPDTIDLAIMDQVETNAQTEEFVWSPADSSLYDITSNRAVAALGMVGSVRMVFPPHTMISAWEKDGTKASPAFRPLHPHSNQWLKAQVCNHKCAYRAGTSSLKRPITIRDHFRKCVYLTEDHPLKVLCALELAAHERASQGLLPARRRTRGGRSISTKSEAVTLPQAQSALGRVRSHTAKSSTSHSGLTSGSAGGETTDSDSDYVPPGGNHSNYRYISYNTAQISNGRSPLGQADNIDTSMASVKEEEDVAHESDTGKGPRSLLGITSVAGQNAPMPVQAGSSVNGHARRHTIGDTRFLFAGGQTMADFLESTQDMPEAAFGNTPIVPTVLPMQLISPVSLDSQHIDPHHAATIGPFTPFDGMYSSSVGLLSHTVSAPHSPFCHHFPSLLHQDAAYAVQGEELSAAFRAFREKDTALPPCPGERERDSYIQASLFSYDLASMTQEGYPKFGIAPSEASSTASCRVTSPRSSPGQSTFAPDKLDGVVATSDLSHINAIDAMLMHLNTQDALDQFTYHSPTLRAPPLPLFIQPDNDMYAGSSQGFDIVDEDRKPEEFIL